MFVLPGNRRRCEGCHIRLQIGQAERGIGRVPAVAWIDTYGFMERAQMTSSRSSGRKAAAATEQGGKAAATSQGGKLLPPQGPVDVPRLPAKPTAATPDEAARDGRRVADDQTESNWADSAKPQPRAKNARSSIL